MPGLPLCPPTPQFQITQHSSDKRPQLIPPLSVCLLGGNWGGVEAEEATYVMVLINVHPVANLSARGRSPSQVVLIVLGNFTNVSSFWSIAGASFKKQWLFRHG